jgi:hypothetical protein
MKHLHHIVPKHAGGTNDATNCIREASQHLNMGVRKIKRIGRVM